MSALPIRIVASEACPPGRAMLISGQPSNEGWEEIKRRIAAGEEPAVVWSDVMAREKRIMVMEFGGGAP